jgi:glycosyltransferase involved in cell wall biosynthesis
VIAAEILHVDIAGPLETLEVAEVECLIVFWWKDYPVGQLRQSGNPGRSLAVKPLVESSVDPEVLRFAQQASEPGRSQTVRDSLVISVVICTRDRPEELARCLASLPGQTRVPDEVIVVDNASSDGRTQELAVKTEAIYVREDRPGLDFARNAGVRAASGHIIVYTDDDVRLHRRWLERMVNAFDDERVMAVTGMVLPAELETEAQMFFEDYWSFSRGYRPILFDRDFFKLDQTVGCPVWEIGAGASMAFRRVIFDRVGLFDERLDVGQAGCSGDSEFWHRILTHGWQCRYEPGAVVFHHHRREMAGLKKQIFYYMRGHVVALLVQFQRSKNFGNLRRAFLTMPWSYLRRLVAREFGTKRQDKNRLLMQEIGGYCSGLKFYFLPPRGKKRVEE